MLANGKAKVIVGAVGVCYKFLLRMRCTTINEMGYGRSALSSLA